MDAAPGAVAPTDNARASVWFLAALLISVGNIWLIKTLGQDYTPFQLLLLRGLVMAALIGPFALKARAAPPITDGPVRLAARSLIAFGGQAFGIAALAALPIAQAQTLSFTKGFIVVGLAVLILHEKVTVRRWAALALGFAGVVIALEPGAGFDPAVAFALASAACFAVSTILVKQLTQEADNLTLLFWSGLGQAALSAPFCLFFWRAPSGEDLAFMGLLGVLALGMQGAMLMAYRNGDVSALAPLDYLRLLVGSLLGWLAFAETPTPALVVGAALIVGANLLLFARPRPRRPTNADAAQADGPSASQ